MPSPLTFALTSLGRGRERSHPTFRKNRCASRRLSPLQGASHFRLPLRASQKETARPKEDVPKQSGSFEFGQSSSGKMTLTGGWSLYLNTVVKPEWKLPLQSRKGDPAPPGEAAPSMAGSSRFLCGRRWPRDSLRLSPPDGKPRSHQEGKNRCCAGDALSKVNTSGCLSISCGLRKSARTELPKITQEITMNALQLAKAMLLFFFGGKKRKKSFRPPILKVLLGG